VQPLDLAALDNLPTKDPAIHQQWLKVREWLRRRPCEAINKGRIVEADISQECHDTMLAYGHCEPIDAERVRGTVNILKNPELMKRRIRVIKHPKAWNDVYGRDTLLGITQIRTRDLRRTVHQGRYAITLDFSAWFDQILLEKISDSVTDEHVADWFCYYFKGQWYRMTRLAMGMRQSVDIADTATRALASYDMPCGVRNDTYIDNLRWIGDAKNDVVTAALDFVVRAFDVGATLNEIPERLRKRSPITGEYDLEALRAHLQSLVVEKGEFLGVYYDYDKKTVKVGEKAIAKLRLVYDIVAKGGTWTHRHLLSAFGVIFFALQATNADAGHRYYALRVYSQTARKLERDPGLLETPWTCCPSQWEHVRRWVTDVLMNHEFRVPMNPLPGQAGYVLVVDASKWGYGAILLNMRTGDLRTWHQRWHSEYQGSRKSAWAEPEGAKRALLHFFPRGTAEAIAVLSDSSTTVDAFRKGRSGAYAVNRAITEFQDVSDLWDVTWHHVPGVTNRADSLSRGETEEDLVKKDPAWRQTTAMEVRRQAMGVPPGGGSQ